VASSKRKFAGGVLIFASFFALFAATIFQAEVKYERKSDCVGNLGDCASFFF